MVECENAGYRRLFGRDVTFGLFFPITSSSAAVPDMDGQVELAQFAAELGFDALWFRDVPTYWPKFGDAGQVYDPWVYLTHVAAHTDDVTLATGSIVLPIRHPLHVAKAAVSIDQLSDGRLVLGVASGDRPPEFEAFGIDAEERGARFRESVETLRTVWAEEFPELDTEFGRLDGRLDVLPKPTTESLPLLVTGYARQSLDWIADNGDGWVFYQLPLDTLSDFVADWRDAAGPDRPFVQAMHVHLDADPTAEMSHIHQGHAAGSEWFVDHIESLVDAGIDHLAINVRGTNRPMRDALAQFADEVMAKF